MVSTEISTEKLQQNKTVMRYVWNTDAYILLPHKSNLFASSKSPVRDVKCAAMHASPGLTMSTSGTREDSASFSSGFTMFLVLLPWVHAVAISFC